MFFKKNRTKHSEADVNYKDLSRLFVMFRSTGIMSVKETIHHTHSLTGILSSLC